MPRNHGRYVLSSASFVAKAGTGVTHFERCQGRLKDLPKDVQSTVRRIQGDVRQLVQKHPSKDAGPVELKTVT